MLAASNASSASVAASRPPAPPEPAPARVVAADGSSAEGSSILFSPSSLPSLPYLPSLSSLASLLSSLPGLSSLPQSDLSPLTTTLSALLSDSIENVVYHAKLFARHGGDWWHARDRDKERMETLTAQRSRQSAAAAVSRQREEQKEEDDSLREYIGFLSQLVRGGKAASPLVKAEREASSAAVLSGQRVVLRDEHFGVWDERERKMVERIQQELAAAQKAKEDEHSTGRERKSDSSNSERKTEAGSEESSSPSRAVREQPRSRAAPRDAPLSPSSPTFIPVSPPSSHHHPLPAAAAPSSTSAVPSSSSPDTGGGHAMPLSRPHIAHHSSAPLTHAVPTLSGWSAVVGRNAAVSVTPPASPPVSAPPVTTFGYFNPSTNLFVPSSREAPVVTSHAPPITASLPHEDYVARASSFAAQPPAQHHSLQHPAAAASSLRTSVLPAPQPAAALSTSYSSPAVASAEAAVAQLSADAGFVAAPAPPLPPVPPLSSASPPAALPSPPLSPSAPSPLPAEPIAAPVAAASSDSSAEIPVAPPLDDSIPVAPSLDGSIPEPPPLLSSSASSSRLPPPLSLSSSSSSSSTRCSLKRVHWSKLQYEHVQSSVWSQLLQLQGDGQQGQGSNDGLRQLLDLSELQSKFASGGGLDRKAETDGQEKAAGKGGLAGDKAAAGKAGEEKGGDDGAERRSEINASRGKASSVFRAIDALRAYNVEIAVSQLKTTASSIRDGLLLSHWQRGDAAIEQHLQLLTEAVSSDGVSPPVLPAAFSSFPFTVDQVDILCRIVPTEEEAARTLSLPPSSSSGSVETFFRVMSAIPRCKRRVELLAFLLSSSAELLSVAASLSCLHAAHVAVTSSSSLPRFLALVLTVGNTLNAGSSQGEAYGFKLSWLREMQQVKTRDGNETLWQFCVQRHEQAEPAALEQQLAPVRAAAAIDTQALTAALHALAAMAAVGRREAALLPEDDALRLLLLLWLPRYEQAVRAVELRCTRMAEEAVVLRRYLAEEEGSSSNGGGSDGGLVLLRDVLDLYVKARAEADRKRKEGAQKERERGRERLKEERRQLSTSSLSTSRATLPSPHGRGAAARVGARGGGVLRREKFVRIRPASPEPQRDAAQAASASSSSLTAEPDPLGPL